MATTPNTPIVRWNRIATGDNVVRVGLDRSYFDDLYHFLLIAPWSQLLGIVAGLYLSVNSLFACLYLLGGDVIAGAEPGSFRDAFFFSVQTLSTIGYGVMSPKGIYGCAVVTAEAFIGLLGVAMTSGLMFAKFARPTARVLFTKRLLITNRDGKPHLVFRIANQRGNDVVEASIRVTMGREELTAEGDRLRRLYELKLIRSQQPLFVMTWTVMHLIDESSPFYGMTEQSLLESNITIIITFTGLDGTFATTVHARHLYVAEHVVWGGHFTDIISSLPDERLQLDYSRFDEIEPLRPGEPKPMTKPERRHEAAYNAPMRRAGDAAPSSSSGNLAHADGDRCRVACMLRVRKWLALTMIGLSVLGAVPGAALAGTKVEWSRVDVPEGENAARLSKVLRAALTQAAKKTNFGSAKSITLSAKLVAFSTEQRGDVLRVNCTMMGRVKGGDGARSRISFGGSPAQRAELEKQVLTMVANGLVARLAQIVRTHAPR